MSGSVIPSAPAAAVAATVAQPGTAAVTPRAPIALRAERRLRAPEKVGDIIVTSFDESLRARRCDAGRGAGGGILERGLRFPHKPYPLLLQPPGGRVYCCRGSFKPEKVTASPEIPAPEL